MRLKHIYIRPEWIEEGEKDWDIYSVRPEFGRTAEYTDLTRVWHDRNESPKSGADVFVIKDGAPYGAYYVDGLKCFATYDGEVIDLSTVERWAYVCEIMPTEEKEGGK